MSLEKVVDPGASVGEGCRPAFERLAAGVRQLVRALGGAGDAVVPFAADEPLLLERAEGAVEVADVDALFAGQLGQPLEQVVAVRLAFAQEQEQRRDLEALDAPTSSVPPSTAIHMCVTYISSRRGAACG